MDAPRFPLVLQYESGERKVLQSREDAEIYLEWYDSDAPEGPSERVTDALGRPVSLKIEKLRLAEREIRRAAARLDAERMAGEVEVFAAALERDLIGPADFRR